MYENSHPDRIGRWISAVHAFGGILAIRAVNPRVVNPWSCLDHLHDEAAHAKSTTCCRDSLEQREREAECLMKAHP